MNVRIVSATLVLLLGSAGAGHAALSLTSLTYSQNFDSLASTGTTNAWTNDSTIPGWYWQTSPATTTYSANDGSSATTARYSYGSSGSGDRAMGHFSEAHPNTTHAAWGIVFQNNTGSEIVALTVDYIGEQWRQISGSAGDSLQFSYRTSASNITDLVPASGATPSGWTAVSSLDFTAPQSGGGGGGSALDGNAAANRTQKTGTISVNIPIGNYFALRWYDGSRSGNNNDAGMGIDDLAVTAAIPEPSAYLFGGLVCGVMGLALIGRRLIRTNLPACRPAR